MRGMIASSWPCVRRFIERLERTFLRQAVQLVGLLLLSVVWAAPVHAQCSPVGPLGCWETWDFTCLIPDAAVDHPQGQEFSHLALIPHGNFKGKILLWRSQRLTGPDEGCTTNTYIFDPANPTVFLKIDQTLQSEIFCSGISWDKDGNLVVAGGLPSEATGLPKKTYRFFPLALSGLIYEINPPPIPCGPQQVIQREVLGTPWRQTGDMSVARYYPGLITLCKGDILSASNACAPLCPDLPGSSTFVSGGRAWSYYSMPVEDILGTDFWQLLAPYPGGWSHTLVSDLDNDAKQLPFPSERETYVRMPASAPINEVILNNYPRCLQLTNIGTPPLDVHRQNIFIANDIWPDTGSPPLQPETSPGLSWVARMPLVGGTLTNWEVWYGPSASAGGQPNDRYYGDAVLMHTLEPSPTSNGKNRVLTFGGLQKINEVKSITTAVQEFRPGANPASQGGTAVWIDKDHDLQVARSFLNAVVLPTGKVLIVGGLKGDPEAPLGEFRPELFHPGTSGAAANQTSQLLQASPDAGIGFGPYTRGYHSLAGLLPDGRVVSAGGQRFLQPSDDYNDQFSVQLFSPPYLGLPDRPTISAIQKTELVHGESFWVDVDYDFDKPIVRFALLRPAARTHHFDSDQRYIELDEGIGALEGGIVRYTLTAPAQDEAPLGYYMLFAVRENQPPPNQELNPSIAVFLRIQ
jgi:hypothetical protein